ncbi:enhancer of mRNA-decapping protein 4 homolog isoform X2 [Anopheles stephensi]|uniref:enhancer of mRNA-decapping protein 4 homolog isoform X2 n=1 Tax=Anopheles stephensi TaxID=30069 RepID=UPI00165895B0|nr:enhancer of mRNA-decapping protein 4 homolog isoform X2 [Anopheles stephensi]
MLILATITNIECLGLLHRLFWGRGLADTTTSADHHSCSSLSHPIGTVDSADLPTMETTTVRTVSTVASSNSSSSSKKFAFSVEEAQHSFKTTDKNITVVCTEGKHDRGSSKIKLVNVVNFKWEQKNYPGRLIACHKDCFLLAYSIRVTKQSKSESMVRVAHLDLPERGLIKGLSDEILDLQFSHNSTHDCLLGIIERTTLHVHKVLVKGDKVTTALKVKIVDPLEGHVPVCDRITWCPYLSDGTDYSDDFAKELLVWTRGSTFQCYSISALTKSYIDTTDLKASDIEEGGFKANDGDATITGSVFSDDGTTLALSSSDGLIRFYQVYQHANDRSPRRLHLWKPHDGKPITSFFFLDNYTETVNNKTIWKHAITCAENNAEIKVWCCESWECLQTVRLTSPVADASLHFKAEIDISSTYLVLTERTTRQIYVLQIRKGKSTVLPDADAVVHQSKKTILTKESTARPNVQPYIVSIAEYPLSASVLGFAILYASSGNSKYGDYDDDEDDEQSSPQCVVIRMFLVQPNNLQDCTLMYEAIPESDGDLLSNDLGNEAGRSGDADATESHENSSSVTSSASSETTDNNVSHPPSEEDDELAAKRKATAVVAAAAAKGGDANNGINDDEEDDDGSDNPDVEENGAKPIQDKMAEAAQKLNDVFVAIRTVKTSADGTNVGGGGDGGGTSAPTTPANSSTKVNLMTPDSFSTPVSTSGSRSAGKENVKDVRIINLSELPYPEMETIMNQYDRRAAGRRRGARGITAANAATTMASTTTGARNLNASVTSTASANGSVPSDGTTSCEEQEEEEEEGGGGNTSVASLAGSERIANITDDPDEDDGEEEDDEEEDEQTKVVSAQVKKKGRKLGYALAANGGEQAKGRKGPHSTPPSSGTTVQPGGVLKVSRTSLNMEHFTKILTLDDAEPPTVREKMKNDESVKPEVLNTLFMLAKATQQHQQQPAEPPASSEPPGGYGLAFANIMKSLSEQSEENATGKTKHRNATNNGPAGMTQESVIDAPAVPPMPSAEMLASGGSSPSREVQQIMSTKDPVISMVEDLFMYSCVERKDDYEDEEEEEDDEEEEGVVNVADRYDEEDGVVVTVVNGTDDNPDEVADEKAPEPMVTDASALLSQDQAAVAVSALKEPMEGSGNTIELEEATKRGQEPARGNSPGESVPPARADSTSWPSTVPTDVPTVGPSNAPVHVIDSSKEIAALGSKMDRMMELLLVQSQQIGELNVQLDALKKSKAEEQRRFSTALNRLGQTLPKTIETQLSAMLVQHMLKIEQTLLACFNNQQARLAETLTHLPQAMIAQLPSRLTPVLLQEMQKKLLPAITGKLDLVQHALGAEMTEKLHANEGAMRDIIQRTLRSEPVTKTMAAAIHSGMTPVLVEVYNQSLNKVILPTYSASSKELFRQMSKAFSDGIVELMRRIDHHVDRVDKMQERTNGMIDIFVELPDKLGIAADDSIKMAARLICEGLDGELRALEKNLVKSMREQIGKEIEKGFQAQTSSLEDSVLSVVRSQAQTPAPSNMDVQDQIRQHLNGGQINKAFHKALLSNDLSLVEYVLERADHKQVFNPCPLEQTVLLSLIQQISADMANFNELKHKYLSDAIVSLDPQDPVTKEHSPKVMLELINNCQKFMTDNPSNPLCTSLKMLVIAAQYMGFKNI